MSFLTTFAASLLLAIVTSTVQADSFGTLFTTAEQRAKLDRGSSDTAPATTGTSGGTAQAAAPPQPLKLNGTLIGRSGKKEVWINGQPEIHNGKHKHPRVNLVKNGSVHFKPSATGTSRLMKSGQVYNPQTGTVSESFQQVPSTYSEE